LIESKAFHAADRRGCCSVGSFDDAVLQVIWCHVFLFQTFETKDFQKPNPTSNLCQEGIAKTIKIQEHQTIIPSARVCKRS
jgi:hypothetical protein